MLYIIDSYAWVEYFIGSQKGKIMQALFLESENKFMTVDCCLAEIKCWSLKQKHDFEELFKVIRANSHIISLTEHNWIKAGEKRHELRKSRKGFGLIDATLLIKQAELNCSIISGDPHFKGLPKIKFL